MGSAAACSAQCANIPITSPASGDGCCPMNANANNDMDCTAMCGNRVVEKGEVCDGNCPTSCPKPSDECMASELMGDGCQAKCVDRRLEAAMGRRDGCCPARANSLTDADCEPECGNRVTERGETCDADCPTSCPSTGDECFTNERTGTECNYKCTREAREPSRTRDGCCADAANGDGRVDPDCIECGNNIVEPGEECDETSSTCVSCRIEQPPAPTGWNYATRCDKADDPPYTDCAVNSGVSAVCHAGGFCAPKCSPDLPCPANSNGRAKPTCAILCQLICTGSADCPSGMTCATDGMSDYAICTY